MENSARITGYCVVLAILAGLMSVTLMLREGVLFPNNRVKVHFPTVGTLMEDDPVKMHGVEVGRVDHIEAGENAALATLELYRRVALPKDSRFINYNYSMFGARMIILVPGHSPEAMDQNVIQQGDFSTGVTEAIHRVDDLLKTVVEYQTLSAKLQRGTDSTPSLQGLLTTQIYPALEEFGRFSSELELLQLEAESELERLAKAGGQVNSFSKVMAANTDTMVLRANRTLEQLATLTAQSTVLLRGLEEIMIAAQDTTNGAGSFTVQRDLYDKALSLTHALQTLLKVANQEGLQDAIHFWRNIHVHFKKKPAK